MNNHTANVIPITIVSETKQANWTDWRWQQKNTLKEEAELRQACGGWGDELTARIDANLQGRKLQITPYYLRQIMQSNREKNIENNPLL